MIELRRATGEDAAAVAAVFLASFHATYDFPLAHSDDEVREWVRDRLIPEHEVWVADENGAVVARARRFYEANGFEALELTDGSGNQERQPDVRYAWRFVSR